MVQFKGHEDYVSSCLFSPISGGSSVLISGSYDKCVTTTHNTRMHLDTRHFLSEGLVSHKCTVSRFVGLFGCGIPAPAAKPEF